MPDAPRHAPTTLTPPLWRNVSFLLMWSSVAASGFGDRLIQLAAEPMLGVYGPTAQAASIQSAITFFFVLPYMAFTLFGGWLADHFPRKWILLACDQSRAVVLLVAFFMIPLGTAPAISALPHITHHYWKIYLIVAATGAFAAIFNPARSSTVPQIVHTHHLQRANAVLLGMGLIASLVGLTIGGPLVEKVSVRAGVMTGFLCFAISGWFFAFLRIRPRRTSHAATITRTTPTRALTYIRRHRAVRNLIVLNILYWVAAYVVYAAIAALNKRHYALPIESYLSHKSTMLSILGAGMLSGSFLVAWIRTRRESGTIAMLFLLATSAAMLLLAINRSYGLGLALAYFAGLFGGSFMILIDTLTQSITANFVLGRVFGLRAMLNTASGVAVNLIIWRLPQADAWMIPALYVAAPMLTVIALVGLWRQITVGPMPSRMANTLWRLGRLYCLVWHHLTVVAKHHVPTTGPVIIASNHTTGVDPFLLQTAVRRLITWLMLTSYMTRPLSFLWRTIRPIGLSRDTSDLGKIRQLVARLRDGDIVGLFPEGRLQREHRDLNPFEPGIAMVARRGRAVIVPTWICGTPRAKNMLWHFAKPSHATVTFGPPYRPSSDQSDDQIVAELRARMLALAPRPQT